MPPSTACARSDRGLELQRGQAAGNGRDPRMCESRVCRPCGVRSPGPVSMLVMTWLRAAGCTASAAPRSLQPAARRLAGMPGRRPRLAAVGAARGWAAGSPLRVRIKNSVCEQPGQHAPRLWRESTAGEG